MNAEELQQIHDQVVFDIERAAKFSPDHVREAVEEAAERDIADLDKVFALLADKLQEPVDETHEGQ